MTTTVATPTDLAKLQALIDGLTTRVKALEAQVDGGPPSI